KRIQVAQRSQRQADCDRHFWRRCRHRSSSGAPSRRIGPGAGRDSAPDGRRRFAVCRTGWRNRRCNYSEFSIQSAGGKTRFQRPALAWGAIRDASVGSGGQRRNDSKESRAGSWIGQGDLSRGGFCESQSGRDRSGFHEWTRVDRELAVKSYELGTKSWPDNLIISDAAIKAVVDQAQVELKLKGPIPLDKVRDWSFAEKATRK